MICYLLVMQIFSYVAAIFRLIIVLCSYSKHSVDVHFFVFRIREVFAYGPITHWLILVAGTSTIFMIIGRVL